MLLRIFSTLSSVVLAVSGTWFLLVKTHLPAPRQLVSVPFICREDLAASVPSPDGVRRADLVMFHCTLARPNWSVRVRRTGALGSLAGAEKVASNAADALRGRWKSELREGRWVVEPLASMPLPKWDANGDLVLAADPLPILAGGQLFQPVRVRTEGAMPSSEPPVPGSALREWVMLSWLVIWPAGAWLIFTLMQRFWRRAFRH